MNDEPRKDDPVEENANTEELVEAFVEARKKIISDDNMDADVEAAEAREALIVALQEEAEVRESLIVQLKTSAGALQSALDQAATQIVELQASATPAGDAELRALAATVRTAQRNGHPDAAKHLDALLRTLGA
ncbi:MAG: hypothetical protein ACXABY_03905 [Candidatus Thorarchaeota archaeon]|jgi:hypothetical protein